MKRIVVIGGGTGQSIILRGLKDLEDIHLSSIVTVADDGGSTGRLREQYNIPAMGDIRSVMIALAESESLLSKVMAYRFKDEHHNNELSGHNLGNLILTALTESTGSFLEAIGSLSQVLRVKGDIIPASLEIMSLFATMEDGTIVRGESNIPNARNHIRRVFYEKPIKATATSLEAITQADVIVFGIGSLYTSILPNLIIDEIRRAINQNSSAKKIYYCNVMTQVGETDGYTSDDHIQALYDHGIKKIDAMVVASDQIPETIIYKYQRMNQFLVVREEPKADYRIIAKELLAFNDDIIRHDSARIKETFAEILGVLEDNDVICQ